MTERFYCVGCKSHYELPVHEAVKKPSKGGSYRHSIVSECPKGHKTTRICSKLLYADYHNTKSAESPLTDGPTPDGPPSEPTPVPSAAQGFSSRCEVHEAEFEACGCEKEAHGYVDGDGKCACGCVLVDCECGPECKCGCATKKAESFEATVDIRTGVAAGDIFTPAQIKKIKEISADYDAAVAAGDYDNANRIAEQFDEFMPCVCDGNYTMMTCECGPKCKCLCAKKAESFEATQVVGTMSPGVNLEALEPLEGGMENGYGDSLVPAHSFQPEGSGHVIGSQSTSVNYTPMHAETFNADDMYPYYELRMVERGTWGDPVDDWDEEDKEAAFESWEDAVNEDGPYILVYWKNTESDGHVVAGEDFLISMDAEESQPMGNRNRNAAIATATAAIVIGLIYWKSQKE